MSVYFNINSGREYEKNMRPSTLSKMNDNTIPSTNQYSFFSDLNAVRMNCGQGVKGEIVKKLGYLHKGDVVKLSVEVKNLTGEPINLTLDESTGANAYGLNTLARNFTSTFNDFELLEIETTVPMNGFYIASTGFLTVHAGNAYVRNFKGEVKKNSNSGSSAIRDERLAFISIENGIANKRAIYGKDDYSIELFGTTIKVNWDIPITSSMPATDNRALTFVGNYQITGDILPICWESTNESCDIRFRDLKNDTFVNISTITRCEFPIRAIG